MDDNEVVKELKEQTKWLRFLSMSTLKKVIEEKIKTEEQKSIYTLSNGRNSTNDISKKLSERGIKVSHMTVYNYWKRWSALGIVKPSEVQSGRFEKVIDLEDLNIK